MNSTLVLWNSGNRKWWSWVLRWCCIPATGLSPSWKWHYGDTSPLRTKLRATLSSELRIELFPSHCFCSTSQTPTSSPLTIRVYVQSQMTTFCPVFERPQFSEQFQSCSPPDCQLLTHQFLTVFTFRTAVKFPVRMFCLLTGKTSQGIIIEWY